jgi:hypothetical protein
MFIQQNKRADSVIQKVNHLSRKCEALGSIPSTENKN